MNEEKEIIRINSWLLFEQMHAWVNGWEKKSDRYSHRIFFGQFNEKDIRLEASLLMSHNRTNNNNIDCHSRKTINKFGFFRFLFFYFFTLFDILSFGIVFWFYLQTSMKAKDEMEYIHFLSFATMRQNYSVALLLKRINLFFLLRFFSSLLVSVDRCILEERYSTSQRDLSTTEEQTTHWWNRPCYMKKDECCIRTWCF